jgi:hypothetical protein
MAATSMMTMVMATVPDEFRIRSIKRKTRFRRKRFSGFSCYRGRFDSRRAAQAHSGYPADQRCDECTSVHGKSSVER